MGHRHDHPPGSGGSSLSGIRFYLLIGVLGVAFIAGMTTLGYLAVGETTDQRIEKDRGEAARMAERIQNTYVSYRAEHGEWPASAGDTLKAGRNGTPHLEGGKAALHDPWGKQFQVEMQPDASGKPQPVVWTTDPRGQRVGFPSD